MVLRFRLVVRDAEPEHPLRLPGPEFGRREPDNKRKAVNVTSQMTTALVRGFMTRSQEHQSHEEEQGSAQLIDDVRVAGTTIAARMDPPKKTPPSTRYESVRADGSGSFLLDLLLLDSADVDESCFPDTIRTHTNMDPAQINAGT